jgi:hypothetical protein
MKNPVRMSAPLTSSIAIATSSRPECMNALMSWMASGSCPTGSAQSGKKK